MPETTVISLKGRLREVGPSLQLAPDVAYIGRPMYQGGWKLARSPFANPYRAQRVGGSAAAVEMYRELLRTRPDLVALARQTLRGKRIGCWCKPGACHGDVLRVVAEGGEP